MKFLLYILLITAVFTAFGCKKKHKEEPAPIANTTPEKTIKITYEVNSSVAAFDNEAYNKLMFTAAEGSYLFDTFKGTTWKKEVNIIDNGKSSIGLHVDMLLNGDKATATGKIYINDELKVTSNSTSPYYSNGRTQTLLDVKYR
ncbi:hypothetical protein [uncultured Mucilaginibacter sp.]|uniref:hypothetical protein n=1 Tax=uncultured Mucilaginibacter sp. TaxID=797541 RepID=UPI0025DB00AC|nr:hypothetical protein [uncultured Mucilaginibacter sp.]